MAFFFFEKIDRRGGYCLMDVSTAEAGAVCPVPVALDDHRSATAGARAREVGVHGALSLPEPARGHSLCRAEGQTPASLPSGRHACGVSCRVRTESCPTRVGALPNGRSPRRFTPVLALSDEPPGRDRAPGSPVPRFEIRASARSRPPVRSDCDFSNILIPYVRPVNRFRRSECEFRKCLGPALI